MNSQWKLVPVEPTETMVINGFESVPNECFTDDEVWEQYQEMSGCQQAAFRAKLCRAAMLGSAPSAPINGPIEVVAVINEEGTIFKETVVEHRPGIELLPAGTELVDIAHVIRLTAERDALQQRLNAADQLNDERAGTCEWSREEDSGIWNSGCGETWSFHEDGPGENGMHFCHSCGKHLVVEVAEQEQDEDWRMHPCKQGHRDVGAAGGVAACNQCGEKVEAATTQEAFEQWNASHQPAIEKPDSPFTEQFIEDHLGNPANSRSKP